VKSARRGHGTCQDAIRGPEPTFAPPWLPARSGGCRGCSGVRLGGAAGALPSCRPFATRFFGAWGVTSRRPVHRPAPLSSKTPRWPGHFGKWHLGRNYPYRPIDRGFDEWIGHGDGGTGYGTSGGARVFNAGMRGQKGSQCLNDKPVEGTLYAEAPRALLVKKVRLKVEKLVKGSRGRGSGKGLHGRAERGAGRNPNLPARWRRESVVWGVFRLCSPQLTPVASAQSVPGRGSRRPFNSPAHPLTENLTGRLDGVSRCVGPQSPVPRVSAALPRRTPGRALRPGSCAATAGRAGT
jgi:hypothetical protein